MNWNCRGTLLLLKQFEIIGKSEVPLLWLWIITTILFTVMHGGAIEAGILPVVNVVTMCLFTTALYEAEGTLLAPIMAHAVWNIVGSLYLGGVSLADDYPQYKLQTFDLDKTGIRICQNIAAVGRYVRNMNDSEKGFSKIIYKKRIPRQMAGNS